MTASFKLSYWLVILTMASPTTFADLPLDAGASDLITRSKIDRLVANGQLRADQVVEVKPEVFVRLPKRPLVAIEQQAFLFLGAGVVACAMAVCAFAVRDGKCRGLQYDRKGCPDANRNEEPPFEY